MGKYRSTHTGQEIDTGVTKALNPDSVPSLGSSALITSDAVNKVQQGFAPIETASAAANAYAVDDLLVYNGVLYKAKTAIYIGDTLTVGTNIEATTIANKLNNVDTQITANTDTTLTGLLKGNGSKVSAETRYIPTVEVTTAQYEALVAAGTVDPDVMYVITDDNSDVSNLATKSNLASIQATGSTNATGGTIPSGTYFYLNGVLVQAKEDIQSLATFTNGTNYSVVTAGALNELKSAMVFKPGDTLTLSTLYAPGMLVTSKQVYVAVSLPKPVVANGANVSWPSNTKIATRPGYNGAVYELKTLDSNELTIITPVNIVLVLDTVEDFDNPVGTVLFVGADNITITFT